MLVRTLNHRAQLLATRQGGSGRPNRFLRRGRIHPVAKPVFAPGKNPPSGQTGFGAAGKNPPSGQTGFCARREPVAFINHTVCTVCTVNELFVSLSAIN